MDERDLYADGWDDGYLRALVDVASELDRIADPAGRVQAQRLLERLRGQAVDR